MISHRPVFQSQPEPSLSNFFLDFIEREEEVEEE